MFRSNATSTAASRASRVVTKIKFMPFAVRHFSSFVFLYFVGRHQSSIRWQFHTHSANANIFECVLEYAYFCVVHVARVYCVHDEFTYRDVDTNWLNWRIRYNNSAGEAESVQVYANASTPIPPSSAAEHSTSIAYGRMEQLNNLITRSEYLYARRDGLSLASVFIVVVCPLWPLMRPILVVDSPTNLCFLHRQSHHWSVIHHFVSVSFPKHWHKLWLNW